MGERVPVELRAAGCRDFDIEDFLLLSLFSERDMQKRRIGGVAAYLVCLAFKIRLWGKTSAAPNSAHSVGFWGKKSAAPNYASKSAHSVGFGERNGRSELCCKLCRLWGKKPSASNAASNSANSVGFGEDPVSQ